jgi:hypothetical protein
MMSGVMVVATTYFAEMKAPILFNAIDLNDHHQWVVFFLARLEAVSRPKPSQIEPGQAKPTQRPSDGFWHGFRFSKPKPAPQAAAF